MAAVRRNRNWSKWYKDMYDNILDQKIAHIIQCEKGASRLLTLARFLITKYCTS